MARSTMASGLVAQAHELAMSNPDLLERFHRHLRYKTARAWQKPLVNPARFARNQLRKHFHSGSQLGTLRVAGTFHCPNFTVVTGERLSESIASYGIFEESLTEACLHLIEPGNVVVDIGMHIGYYTTLFAALVGPKGEVHAFEPTPSTREIAQHNVGQYPQVRVHPFAMWSQLQELEFRDYGIEWMGFNSFTDARVDQTEAPKPKLFQVKTMTLDAFREGLGKPVSFVKIDAESAELEILRGARALLASDRPILSLEVGDVKGDQGSRRLLDFVQGLDYVPWEFIRGQFIRHQFRHVYVYGNLILAPSARDLSLTSL